MKIEKRNEPKAKIQLVCGNAFRIQTAPYLSKLHTVCIAVAKRGSFKTTAISNLLRMYKETGTMDRCIILSPTFHSNVKILEQLEINPEDIFDDIDDVTVVDRVKAIIDEERDAFLRWKKQKVNYDTVMKQINMGSYPLNGEYDDDLMEFYDASTNTFRMPEPRYKCYLQDRPPVISWILDDILGGKICNSRALLQLTQKHRHQSPTYDGSAVGISLFFLVQSFKSQNGLNRSIRNQACIALIGRSKDDEERKQIAESFAGEISPDTFLKVHYEATKDSNHDFLYVDLHPKEPHMRFRKNFDQYLIVDDQSL
jgi:hypothetical protein